ncbi:MULTISPECIES: capsid cement protein [Proteus]|uniref:DUF2190 family protein n=1 Tax=Proteus penneri TaxID=102862 RepID=A0ABS0VYJ3_9GAMM|nr:MULTISPECIES: capsid cement protein [Proteus]MBJ2116129.1 DUF2190 family protein [Proteus penneri]MCO8052020.1 DUF2190 family protein [Proteus penneri]
MAKNYVQAGNTIAIHNTTQHRIKSGQLVFVGKVATVALTDIAIKSVGDGITEGVFLLNKKAGITLKAGTVALVKNNEVVEAEGMPAGMVWQDVEASDSTIAVKLNVGMPKHE